MENTMEDQENLKIFLRQAELLHYYDTFRNTLKVTKVSQLKFVLHGDLHQIGLSKPELRRYRELYSLYFPKPYLKKIKQILCAFGISEPMSLGHGHSCNPSDFQPFPENVSKVPTKHIISIEDIKINKQLGVGQFGVVQQGTWTTNNQRLHVAIKCLGHERMASSSSEFLKEAAVMHSIEHPNIVRLYGVVLHLDSLMLVTELAPLRSLLECLREVTLRTSFPVSNLCDFAQQICDGMTYLENKRLIHRDLAARNILVFSKSKVKISDFGLSRALSVGKDYYQTNYNVNLKLPVAWCAPECILYLRFTSASDVWAFGVCLWEMFTYGFQPWAAFSGQQILEAIDEPNYQRLERPECCPDAYYSTMLECWAHDPKFRPKFKELKTKLREIQPIQVLAITDFLQPQDGRRCNLLEYKAGQVITVLGKQNFTKSIMWYGVLPGGTCGMFDPNNTEPYVQREQAIPGSISLSARKATRKSALSRTDTKRHTYTGKRTLRCSMISSPQGDVKHTGHVGVDGASFGDISFLDPACTSGQIVTQYKLSEDLEQVPLLNPSSPSHLSGAMCMPPYPILKATYTEGRNDRDEVDLSYTEKKHKSPKKSKLKSLSEPSTSKSILNKVRSASLGRSQKHEVVQPVCTCSGSEVHEYHEISDTDTEGAAAEWMKGDNLAIPDSPGIPKSCNDFGQSLLDEMEYMFRNLDTRKQDEGMSKYVDNDNARPHTLSKADKKKGSNTGTMKLMSAHDERTLDTAVALANEIITKSMNDLDGDQRVPSSPIDRSKFHFKFPLVSLHQSTSHDADAAGKYERRNFSEEAKSVPDIQSTITAESKLAYASLIEEPMPSTSLISHMEMTHKPATVPKPAPRLKEPRVNFLSLQKELPINIRPSSSRDATEQQLHTNNTINELPLPPRSTKPKLIDKPRHIRKYPLKLPNPNPNPEVSPKTNNEQNNQVIIYQNAITCAMKQRNGQENNQKIYNQGVDVFDGPSRINFDTNPFTNTSGQRYPNPFNPPLTVTDNEDVCTCSTIERKSLGKDYVSVEDLLEFADQKPCGRQRGVESDEVRIMNKVLKHQTTPEECLEALEVSDWNVHQAIKVVKVKLTVNTPIVTLEECMRELANTAGDTTKAIAAIVAYLSDLKQ